MTNILNMFDTAKAQELLQTLNTDGIVILENFLSDKQISDMRTAIEIKLKRMRWNDRDGYQQTERYRHGILDVLTLEQGFVDAALDPLVNYILREYLDKQYELVEAKGWKSLPVQKDFHGWHGDAWFDQAASDTIPKEVKLAFYLTDVNSGEFEYRKGSHRQHRPCGVLDQQQLEAIKHNGIVKVKGKAGTAVLFDSSGIHRQSVPILEPRIAAFYNYHNSSVPLQSEDIEYYRYHPLILNAAFLGNLSDEDMRILGFGNKERYIKNFEHAPKYEFLQAINVSLFKLLLLFSEPFSLIKARFNKFFHRNVK